MADLLGNRRRRDPQERRRAIVEAAAALTREVGSAGLTHRLVAARAQVPLGATTQYFDTLDDLREAALEHLADEIDAGLREVAGTLDVHGASPGAFAQSVFDYICDEDLVRADMAMLAAASVDPALKPLALRWPDGLVALLTPHLGEPRARAVAAFVDGAAMHALLSGTPMSVADLTTALTALTTGGRP